MYPKPIGGIPWPHVPQTHRGYPLASCTHRVVSQTHRGYPNASRTHRGVSFFFIFLLFFFLLIYPEGYPDYYLFIYRDLEIKKKKLVPSEIPRGVSRLLFIYIQRDLEIKKKNLSRVRCEPATLHTTLACESDVLPTRLPGQPYE